MKGGKGQPGQDGTDGADGAPGEKGSKVWSHCDACCYHVVCMHITKSIE